jgi:branched-chain amino acid transport system ATP-binding protein
VPLLELQGVDAYYGRVQALCAISLTVESGEVVTLIGGNGAGKSTALRAITGLVPVAAGAIRFDGMDITRLPAAQIVRRGIAHVPEGRRLFARMTVAENLEMGAFSRNNRPTMLEDVRYVHGLFPRLRERSGQLAGTLSGGEQQMLAIGRALMTRPKLLLLDEPSMGLSPILVEQIFAIIQTINASGTTVLLIEQNARKALTIAQRGYVIETGRIVLTDVAATLLTSDQVKRAYLGE